MRQTKRMRSIEGEKTYQIMTHTEILIQTIYPTSRDTQKPKMHRAAVNENANHGQHKKERRQ